MRVTLSEIVMLGGIIATLWYSEASSHDWYEPACCSDKDCAQITFEAVTHNADGSYTLNLAPGEHPMVPEGGSFNVPMKEYGMQRHRPSQDGYFHACILPSSRTVACLYIPALF